LATVLPFEGKAAEGLEHARQSVKLRQEVLESDPHSTQLQLDLDRAYEGEGDVLGGPGGISLGRKEEAAAVYRKALELVPEVPPGDRLAERATRAKAVLMAKLADLERAGNAPDAVEKYASAVETAEALYQTNPHSAKDRGIVTALLNKLAYTEGALGNHSGSLEHFQKAVDIDEAALAGDPNDEGARSGVIVTLKNLGDLYYYTLSMMPEALRCYRRAAELLELQVKADPGNVAWRANLSEILTDIASGLVATNHVQEARSYDRRGLELAKEVADRPGATGEQMYNYAWLAVTVDPEDLRNPSGALPYALKAVELSKSRDPLCLHVLSQAYSELGDYRRAVEVEEEALALFAPVEAGKPVPRNQGIVERSLKEYRKELQKRAQ
jgi:tetratricopeptide (TPR) repeat protein